MYIKNVWRFVLGSFTLDAMSKSKGKATAASMPGTTTPPPPTAKPAHAPGAQRFSYARKYGGAVLPKGGTK